MEKCLIVILLFFTSCHTDRDTEDQDITGNLPFTKNVHFNDIPFDVVIDMPANQETDVLLVFHGTVSSDDMIVDAAHNALTRFKTILDRKDMMIISVAYPQENLLFGDNILVCEAALLWVKNQASADLGITVHKIFIAGHSQGGVYGYATEHNA